MTMYKDYNTNQLSLEVNLAYDIPSNHEARMISLFVDSIPSQVLLEETSHTGRPAFHPAMLMKMTLFAYARQVFSGRKIVQMNSEVIPMKWLSQDTYVSYKTINNFRSSKHANNLIKTAFIYFTLLMRENGMIEDDALFIDGTKLEADANLYSFTWKRAIDKYEAALNGKISQLYDQLIQEGVNLALSKEERETSQGLEELLEKTEATLVAIEQAIEEEPKVIKGGSVFLKLIFHWLLFCICSIFFVTFDHLFSVPSEDSDIECQEDNYTKDSFDITSCCVTDCPTEQFFNWSFKS